MVGVVKAPGGGCGEGSLWWVWLRLLVVVVVKVPGGGCG